MSAFYRGVAQSDRQACRAWYRKAAKQDFAKAQYQLGVVAKGHGKEAQQPECAEVVPQSGRAGVYSGTISAGDFMPGAAPGCA